MELNPQVKIIIVVGIFLLIISGIPFKIIKDTVSPPKQINQSLNVTPTPIIIYRNITVNVTPEPDGKTYFAGEYQSGIRKMGRYFSWNRDNVRGLKDMSGHVKVYDYRMFSSVHVFDPSDYKYYEILPPEKEKYFFLFVKIYLDDVSNHDVPLWLPNENHFYVQVNGLLHTPATWEKQKRIKELENTWNDNNDFRIAYYGVFNTYSRDLKYAKTAGEVAEPIYYVQAGESNAIDGYIIYTIPENTKEEDIIIYTDIYAFGNPSWLLKT